MKTTIHKAMSSLTAKLAALLFAFTCAGTAWGVTTQVATDEALRIAVANATAGDTILLTADVTLSATLEITKSITLDLNGNTLSKTLSSTTDTKPVIKALSGTVEIKNGTLTYDLSTYTGTVSTSNANLIYLGMNFSNGVYSYGDCTLTLNGVNASVTFPSGKASMTMVYVQSGRLNIIDSNLSATTGTNNTKTQYIIYTTTASQAQVNAYVSISGTTTISSNSMPGIHAIWLQNAADTLIISGNDVTISADATWNPNSYSTSYGYAINNQSGATCTIEGGSFDGKVWAAKGTITVYGGNFSYPQGTSGQKNKFTLADGLEYVENTDPATKDEYPYVVAVDPTVAMIGEAKYESLAAALADVGENAPLTWVKSSEWLSTTPVYYNGTFYETLTAAINAANEANASTAARIYIRPNYQAEANSAFSGAHDNIKTSITIYGNNASINREWEPCIEGTSAEYHILTKDVTFAVYNLHDGAGAWGTRTSDYTATIILQNCTNAHEVLTIAADNENLQTTDVTIRDCTFDDTGMAHGWPVSPNTPGNWLVEGCTFANLHETPPINFNNKHGGALNATMRNCTFVDCGKASDTSASIIRLAGLAGTVNASFDNLVFTDCIAANDIVIGNSSLSKNLAGVTYSISNTACTMTTYEMETGTTTDATLVAANSYTGDNAPPPVAQIGDVGYKTFAAAIDAAETYAAAHNGVYPTITVLNGATEQENTRWSIVDGYLVRNYFYQDASDANLWHIENLEGLKAFRDSINSDKVSYANKTIKIDADIDLTNDGYWESIKAYPGSYLSGATIDGDGHTITGMAIVTPDPATGYSYGGGFIDKTAGALTVTNLKFINATVTAPSGSQVGVVIGMTYGNVTLNNVDLENCTVTGITKTGAFVGQNDDGTVALTNCDLVNTKVYANYSSALMIGLLNTNSNGSQFNNCTADGNSEFIWMADADNGFETKGDVVINGRTYSVSGNSLWLTDPGTDCWSEQRIGNATYTYDGVSYSLKGSVFYPNYVASITRGGVTTKYASAQEALDQVVSGDTLTLYAGDHGTLYIRQNAQVSVGVDVKQQAGEEYGTNDRYRSLAGVTITGQTGATLTDLVIEAGAHYGTNHSNPDYSQTLDSFMEIDNLTISGLTFNLKGPPAIDLASAGNLRLTGLTVDECTVNGTGNFGGAERLLYCTLPSKHLVSRENSPLSGVTKTDVDYTTGLSNLVVTDCTFNNLHQVMEVRNVENLTFTNNTISNTASHALLSVSDTQNPFSLKGIVTVSGNTATSVGDRFFRTDKMTDATVTLVNNTIISSGKQSRETGNDARIVAMDTGSSITYTVSGNSWNGQSDAAVLRNTALFRASPAVPIYVAQIGSDTYETFAAAITAAEEYAATHDGSYPTITVLDATAELADLDWKIADGKLVHKNVIATLAQGGAIVGKYEDLHEALEAGKAAGSVVTLLQDINLAGVNWVPVGTEADRFRGTFDGNGKTISNLTIDYTAVATSSTTYGGLIGGAQGATVRNVKLNNVVITNGTNPSEQPTAGYGGRYGAVVGRLYGGTVSNCTVTNVEIQDMGHNGGIVGATEAGADSTIENCKVQGTILIASGSNSGGGWDVGGILGKNNGGKVTITGCTVDGTSAATSKIYSQYAVGGIVGYTVNATITGSTVKNVTVEASSNVVDRKADGTGVRCGAGGIMGELKGTISGCSVENVIVKYDDTTTTGAYAAVGLIGGACEAGVTINVSDCTVSESSAYWGETKVNHLDPGRRTSGAAMTVNYTNTAVGSIVSNGITTYYVTAVDAIAAADREGVDEIAIIDNKIEESPDNAWKIDGDKLVRKPLTDYVTLTLTIDDNYAATYPENVAAARAMYEGKKYASLAEAQAAFASLFGWNGSGYGNPNNGPFKNAVASNGPTPVTKVTFDLYGTTECGTITLGNFSTSSLYLMSVDVVGHDGAKISGNANISANVAGGYDNHHTTGGKLFVTNIEFTAETDNIQCYASCANIGTTDKTVEPSELEIAGCTFHTQLYMYSHSNDDGKMTYNIHDNAFVGSGVSNQANALHAQTGVDKGPTAINFYNNIVSNYTRGININVSSANQTKTANVYGNTIYPGVGYSAVQLSTINVANVHDNMIYLNAGNAITLHENLYAGAEVNVANNTIAYADGASVGYIVYDDAQAGNKTDALACALTMTYTGNTVAGGISTTQGVKGSNVYGLRPYVYYVLNGIVAGVVTDVGATTNLFTTIDAAIAKADEVGVNEVLLLGNGAENTNSNWKAGEGNKLVRKAYVAQIGSTKFESLAAAVAAAQNGDTIELVADSTENFSYTEWANLRNKSLALTGNHTLTSTSEWYGYYFGDYDSGNRPETDQLAISNVTFAKNGGNYTLLFDGVAASLNGVTVNGAANTALSYANGATGVLENVTVANTGSHSAAWRNAAIALQGIGAGPSQVIVKSGTYTSENGYAAYIFSSGGILTIEGGDFVGKFCANIDRNTYHNDYNQSWIYITGGNFKNVAFETSGNTDYCGYVITGGLFDADPSAYVADGYAAVELTEGVDYNAGYRYAVGKVETTDLVPAAGATEKQAEYNFNVIVTNGTEILETVTDQTITVRVDDANSIADVTLNDFDVSGVLASAVSAVGTGSENVTVDLRVSSADVSSGKVTFEAHPEAVIQVGTATPEVVTLTNDELADGATFSLKFYTGESFAVGTLVKITHKSADYEDEVFIASVAEDTAGRYVPVTVSHFSSFEIEPFTPDAGMVAVNKNTGAQYATLADAYAELKSGETIVLLADIEGPVEFYRWDLATTDVFTLDLNGYAITSTSGATLKLRQMPQLVIKDSSEEHTGRIEALSTSSNAIDFPTVESKNNRGKLTIEGGTIRAQSVAIINRNATCRIVIDGEYANVISQNNSAIQITKSSAVVVINNGTVQGKDSGLLVNMANTVEINGGCINGGTYGARFATSGAVTTLKISDGSFYGDTDGLSYASTKTKFISGGLYSSEPAAKWIKDGYVMMANDDSETSETYPWKVVEAANAVAKIGSVGYTTLADAIAAAQDGDTITLLADCETGSQYTLTNPLVLTADNVMLDLNGKTITATSNFSFLISGDNDVVTNGTIQAGANTGKQTGINSYAIVVNGCDGVKLTGLTVNGGISIGGSTGETPNAAAATNVVIEDCTVTSGDFYAVCAQQNSTVTITSGTYTADTSSTYSGVLQGTFTGTDGPKGTISVTGGTFNGKITNNNEGDIVVSGGNFSAQVPEKYCAPGYIPAAQDPETGMYTVKQGAYVAQIGANKYESFRSAIEAVNASGEAELTLKLLTNVNEPLTSDLGVRNTALTITSDVEGGVELFLQSSSGYKGFTAETGATVTIMPSVKVTGIRQIGAYGSVDAIANLNNPIRTSQLILSKGTVNINPDARIRFYDDGAVHFWGGSYVVNGSLAAGEGLTATIDSVGADNLQWDGGYVNYRYNNSAFVMSNAIIRTQFSNNAADAEKSTTFDVSLNNSVIYATGGTFALGGAVAGTLTLNGSRIVAAGAMVTNDANDGIVMDWRSSITAKNFVNSGTVAVDMTGFDGELPLTLITTTDADAVLGDFEVINNASGATLKLDANGNIVAVKAVAKIGDRLYGSLGEAIAAAQDGDTVEIVADIAGETVTVSRNVTVTGASDAEGKPARTLTDTVLTLNGTTVELAVTNLAFTGTSYINANNGAALTVDHVTATVNPAKITGRSAFIVLGTSEPAHGLAFTLTNSTIVNTFGNDPYGAAVFGWRYLSSAVITDNVLGSADYRFRFIAVKLMNAMDGAAYTIERNTIYGTNANYNFYAFDLYQNCSRDNSYTALSKDNVLDVVTTGSHKVYVFDIERNGDASTKTIVIDSDSTLNGEAVTLNDFLNKLNVNAGFYGAGVVYDANGKMTAGTFNRELSDAELEEFVAEGLRSFAVGDGTYTLYVPVAQIGETKYETLADAIAAVPANGTATVQMIADSAEVAGSVVAAGKTIVLDLNGKAISYTSAFPAAFNLIAVNGNLTVTDTSEGAGGSIALVSTANLSWDYAVNMFLVGGGGSLTIEKGSYSVTTPGHGYAEYVIAASNNSGSSTVVVNGGTFTGNKIDAVVRLHDQRGRNQPLNVTVNGGDFTLNGGSDSVIWFDVQNSNSGTDNASVANLVINGGTFTSTSSSPALDLGHSVDASGLRVTVNGGAFKSNGAVIKTRELSAASIANINLAGGIYSGNVFYNDLTSTTDSLNAMCANGCEVVDNPDDDTKAAYPYTIFYTGDIVYPIEGTAGVAVALAWATNNTSVVSEGAPVTFADVPDIIAALGENGANGMPLWQSYVLGLAPADPNATFHLSAGPVAGDSTKVSVAGAVDTSKFAALPNVTITFRLTERSADGTWTPVTGCTGSDSPAFAVPLESVAGKVLSIFADIVVE